MTSKEDNNPLNKTGFDKVFWVGRHPNLRSQRTGKHLSSPLGRLPSSVIKLLTTKYGWEEITDFEEDARLPIFTFCSRKPTDDFCPVKWTSDASCKINNDTYRMAFKRNGVSDNNQELINSINGNKDKEHRNNCKAEIKRELFEDHNYQRFHYICQLSSKVTMHVDCKLML